MMLILLKPNRGFGSRKYITHSNKKQEKGLHRSCIMFWRTGVEEEEPWFTQLSHSVSRNRTDEHGWWINRFRQWKVNEHGQAMVRRSSGTLPTRVQILVLAPFPGFSRIYQYATFPRHWWLRESPDLPVLSPSEVLIGVGFAYMYS
jgi:hypothetical protein